MNDFDTADKENISPLLESEFIMEYRMMSDPRELIVKSIANVCNILLLLIKYEGQLLNSKCEGRDSSVLGSLKRHPALCLAYSGNIALEVWTFILLHLGINASHILKFTYTL